MSELLLAIDTGGTRTNVNLAWAEDAQPIHSYQSMDVLSGSLPPRQYRDALARILAPLEAHLAQQGLLDRELHAFIGAAGFAASTRDDFQEAIYDTVPAYKSVRFKTVGAANDVVALLLGHDVDGAVIAGTGSNVLVRSRDGVLHQSGGHGWVACDYGSAFWVGLTAIRQASREFEAGVESDLLSRLRECYSLKPRDSRQLIAKLRDLSVADESMKPEVAKFAASVCDAADRGDPSAQNIVKKEAEDLADSVASAVRRQFTPEEISSGLKFVECGSLLYNEFYQLAFEAQVNMRLRSGAGDASLVAWDRQKTGLTGLLALADRLRGDTADLMHLAPEYRPVVIRF